MSQTGRALLYTIPAGLLVFINSLVADAEIVISSGKTQNMSCSGGICLPTAKNAALNVTDLENLLASGNVEVTTIGSGVQAVDIKLDAPLSWSATSTLKLDAYQSIGIDGAVTVTGAGGLTVTTNDGGHKGTFSFGKKAGVKFHNLSSPLTISGVSFTLVDSLPSLAAAVKANSNGAYALASNYDASQLGTYSTSPINELDGAIEGLGNAISNLSIDVTDDGTDEGLVVQVGEYGSIENLRLVGINYQADSSKYNGAGGLAARDAGYLFDDEVSGSITSTGTSQAAGGIAGYTTATGTILHGSANVSVTGNSGSFGGLVGWSDGMIELSHASGTVTGYLAGGIVGQNEGPVAQSFASGTVNGSEAGGFVGDNTTDGVYTGTIIDSYATGAVTGGLSGGFVSQDADEEGSVSHSYSTGSVPAEGGGFVCDPYPPNFSYNYWDVTTSGTPYGVCFDANFTQPNYVTPLTTKQLRKKLPKGFDKKIWALNPKINNGFPYLIANPPRK